MIAKKYITEIIKTEIINGTEVMMASPLPNHNRIVTNLSYIFMRHLKGGSCDVFTDGIDVYLSENDVFIPDLSIVCDSSKISGRGIEGAPDLVAEVLSRSTERNDKGHKKTLYGKHGVKEYWIIDPQSRSIDIFLANSGTLEYYTTYYLPTQNDIELLEERKEPPAQTVFSPSIFDGLEIDLNDVFYRVS